MNSYEIITQEIIKLRRIQSKLSPNSSKHAHYEWLIQQWYKRLDELSKPKAPPPTGVEGFK